VHFLGAPDGTLAGLSAEQAALFSDRLRETIKRLRPGEIFTPYRRDGSSEHEAAFGLVTHALGSLPFQVRLYEYPVWAWWNPLLLVRPYFTARRVVRLQFKEGGLLKKDALACHRSQFEPVDPWTSPVIAPAFVSFFTRDEEFYFEI
jgi:LmbE family N-acetylglucosaminyl deacetylase